MADFSDVATNAQMVAIANAIRGITRTSGPMTIPEMPGRLLEIRVVEWRAVSVSFSTGTSAVLGTFDSNIKHVFMVLPASNADAEKLSRVDASSALDYDSATGVLSMEFSRAQELAIDFVVVDFLLSTDSETIGMLVAGSANGAGRVEDYSTARPYRRGEAFLYNGSLCCTIADHSAEQFNTQHNVVLANQVYDSDSGTYKDLSDWVTAIIARFTTDEADVASIALVKQSTPDVGYAETYYLSRGGQARGVKINIPLDKKLASGSLIVATQADVAYDPTVVAGRRYLLLMLSNETPGRVYVDVNDLVDIYTGSNAVSVVNKQIDIFIDSSNANGLSKGATGLKMALASTTGAGAMSAEDKVKLNGVEAGAQVNELEGVKLEGVELVKDADKKVNIQIRVNGKTLAEEHTAVYEAISAEHTRAVQAEDALAENIGALEGRMGTAESAIEGKLDKVESTQADGDKAYVAGADGSQKMVKISTSEAEAGAIPVREAGGAIAVPTPTREKDAVPKAYVDGAVGAIEELIPEQASSGNQLADKAFVNSTVQTTTANFRGSWSDWDDVPSDASLYPEDAAGVKKPHTNDYCVIADASGYPSRVIAGTWRFKYTGDFDTAGKNGWQPEYAINEQPLTTAQIAALNSGITAAKVTSYDNGLTTIAALQSAMAGKQDSLSADQLSAVNSGIDASKVAEIAANTAARHSHPNKELLDTITGDSLVTAQQKAAWSAKQNALTAGENITIAQDGTISAQLQQVDSSMSAASTNPVQNKVVKEYIDAAVAGVTIPVDSSMSDASTNPVQNKVIKEYVDDAISGIPLAVVDAAMSDSSENAVQNKVIKAYVDAHQQTLDDAMSDSSPNAVKNSVIKAYVDQSIAGISTPTVDSAMSSTSTNPVQNKVIKEYVDSKQVTWSSITSKPTAFTPEAHTHGNNDLTGLATWVKQASKPTYTYTEVGADAAGTATASVQSHNADTNAHADLFGSKQDVLEAGTGVRLDGAVITCFGIETATGGIIKMWKGTQAAYEALSSYDDDTLYVVRN